MLCILKLITIYVSGRDLGLKTRITEYILHLYLSEPNKNSVKVCCFADIFAIFVGRTSKGSNTTIIDTMSLLCRYAVLFVDPPTRAGSAAWSATKKVPVVFTTMRHRFNYATRKISFPVLMHSIGET